MKRIIVLGGNGQLGQCLRSINPGLLELLFLSSQEANILEESKLRPVFEAERPDMVINCAAYTAVDLAEDEPLKAAAVNTQGPELVARLCAEADIPLIHISTDFVFDGSKPVPLLETDIPNPVNVYGRTKLHGEEAIIRLLHKHVIIRTSWLYSEFGNNFLKTMIRLGSEREKLGVVSDQVGTPTYAVDLAEVVLKIASVNEMVYGVFHYSNEGVASWYDFAYAIFRKRGLSVEVNPVRSSQYPTKAARPSYSVMDKNKIKETYQVRIPHWADSLDKCIEKI